MFLKVILPIYLTDFLNNSEDTRYNLSNFEIFVLCLVNIFIGINFKKVLWDNCALKRDTHF